ncbi:hypothetical protein Tco_1504269 [Tanacetum coccineum]
MQPSQAYLASTIPLQPTQQFHYGSSTMPSSFIPHATMLSQAFQTMTLQEPAWNMDRGVLVTPNIIKINSVRKFTRDNDVSVEFDAYGFSVKDYHTHRLLFRCDNTGDLYPVTQQPSSTTTFALLTSSPTTWHKHLGHPGEDVLRHLESWSI